MDAMQIFALVLLLVATVVGLAVLAVGAAWVRRSARERARRAARGQKSRSARSTPGVSPTSSAEPPALNAARTAPVASPVAAAAAPAVLRTQMVDLPLLDDEPTQPMMHIDMAPASGWPNTMPASLATMAHQYAETQPAEMQKQ